MHLSTFLSFPSLFKLVPLLLEFIQKFLLAKPSMIFLLALLRQDESRRLCTTRKGASKETGQKIALAIAPPAPMTNTIVPQL